MIISLPFKKLSLWQRTAFCAALVERMLPNYQLFSQSVNFGDSKVLRNQLDLIWQKLMDQKLKINAEAQLIKLEIQIPDPQHFDFFGVFPAIDTCMAIMLILQIPDDPEKGLNTPSQVAQLSQNSVIGYIELILSQAQQEVLIAEIQQHPLMRWELETQQELLTFVLNNKENKQSVIQLKTLAVGDGLSNLGIDIAL